jgi:hypothetical protein
MLFIGKKKCIRQRLEVIIMIINKIGVSTPKSFQTNKTNKSFADTTPIQSKCLAADTVSFGNFEEEDEKYSLEFFNKNYDTHMETLNEVFIKNTEKTKALYKATRDALQIHYDGVTNLIENGEITNIKLNNAFCSLTFDIMNMDILLKKPPEEVLTTLNKTNKLISKYNLDFSENFLKALKKSDINLKLDNSLDNLSSKSVENPNNLPQKYDNHEGDIIDEMDDLPNNNEYDYLPKDLAESEEFKRNQINIAATKAIPEAEQIMKDIGKDNLNSLIKGKNMETASKNLVKGGYFEDIMTYLKKIPINGTNNFVNKNDLNATLEIAAELSKLPKSEEVFDTILEDKSIKPTIKSIFAGLKGLKV